MRCPECEQRNSVAASKCKFCGAKFKRKQMPKGKRILVLALVIGLSAVSYLMIALPKMVDPTEQLLSAAKRVAAGPRSPEDAKKAKQEFEATVKTLLTRYGNENSSMLLSRLKNCLPANAFEVLVVDLPKSLKLVEIDTVLQASDFLIMKGTNEVKVFPLSGFEIYDDARSVNDQAGAVIVLVGHSGGQPPHRPLVQTYALLPDAIMDETATMVPTISGEGSAKFIKGTNDINVELSVNSVAQMEKITTSMPISADKVVRMKLQWKDAKFFPTLESPQDQSVATVILANALKHPEFAPAVATAFGPQAGRMLKESGAADLQDISISKRDEKKKSVLYTISSAKKKFDIELKRDTSNNWQLAAYSISDTAAADPAKNSATVVTTQPETNPAQNQQSQPVVTEPPKNVEQNKAQLPGGLQPEKAGSPNVKNPVLSSVPVNSSVSQNSDKNKGSSWLDDEQNAEENKSSKPPVAVLPPGLKVEKNTDDKDKKKNKEKKIEKNKEETSRNSARIHGVGSVRMRSGPGLNRNAIDEIPAGAKVQIIGEKKGWLKVSYAGKVGYVFSPLVEQGADNSSSSSATNPEGSAKSHREVAKPATAQPPSSGTAAVVRRPMTVRDENRRPISSVSPGQHVVVLSGMNQHGRYKIKMPDGTIGYVHKDALDVKVETPPEFVP